MIGVVLILKKRIMILMLAIWIAAVPALASGTVCSAEAMILYEPYSGTVLAEKNADAEMLIASTTKIMTALIVLEHCDVSEPVCPTAEQICVEGSAMYLRAGETYTVEDLLAGLLLASGNDAAVVLAEHTAGSVEAFASLMNEKCAALGLHHTHFVNPHGLDAPEHYSSARDLAVITAEAMKNETFCRLFSAPHMTVHGTEYYNHNKLLNSCEGCIGGKTGYTMAAGRVLVSCAEREGLRLICVTISDPNDWTDHNALYDEAFADWRFVPLPDPAWSRMLVLSGTAETVALSCRIPGIPVPKDTAAEVQTALPRFVFAPVRAGEQVGSVRVTVDGETVLTEPIFAAEAADADASVPLRGRELMQRGWERYCKYSRYRVYPVYY